MDTTFTNLVARIEQRLKDDSFKSEKRALWIAVAGPPGSGKTTLTHELATRLDGHGIPACVIPMDGFHYYRHELDQMPNPEEAHAKRGSHWTFNAARLVETLRTIRENGCGAVPSFDHAVGDPVEDDIRIENTNSVILVEGNYLLLYDIKPWDELKNLFDETWYISCEEAVLRERVIERNGKAWGWDRERTAARVDSNDMVNARVISTTAKYADLVISSVQDPTIAARA